MAFPGADPPPASGTTGGANPYASARATASARAAGSGIRHTGPVEMPWQGPKHGRDGLGAKITFGVVTVVLFAVAGVGLFYLTGTGGSGAPAGNKVADNGPAVAPGSPSPGGSPAAKKGSAAPSVDTSPPSGVRMPIGDIPGWHQTFTDDFTGNALSDKWYSYAGQPAGDPGGWYEPGHVSVGGGMLTISGSKQQTPHGLLYATGGISNHNVFSQTYGRFDVRFRMDKGVGIMYALLLWPSDNKWPPEIDIIEDNGSDRSWTTSTMHYGANDSTIERRTKGDFTQWHTATLEWTPGHLVYKLDGKVWGTIDSSHVPSEPMDLALQTQAFNCGGAFEKCPNSTTPPVVNLEVDWVSCYEWTGP
jgi:hypothetical protein